MGCIKFIFTMGLVVMLGLIVFSSGSTAVITAAVVGGCVGGWFGSHSGFAYGGEATNGGLLFAAVGGLLFSFAAFVLTA